MDEDPRPLDVAQEGVAEAGPVAGALDEPGHVGDRRPALVLVAEVHDAEVRLERRERVVGDLRRGRGQGREERRLAGVRQPDEADVGDEPQLEAEPALLAGLALLGVLGGLVGGRREVGVAEAAAAAARDHRLLADRDEVGDQLAGLVVVDGRPGRDRRGPGPSPALPWRREPLAAAAGRRLEVVLEPEVAERRLAGIDPQVDRAAAPAVAAVRAAARDVGLPAEGRGPVAAVAGTDPDLHAVEEHQGDSRTADRGDRRDGGPGSGAATSYR